jgi:hypothetical protein
MAGRRAVESSFNVTMVSSAMYWAGWMAHSSSRSKQDRSDEADNVILVEEDPDNLGPPYPSGGAFNYPHLAEWAEGAHKLLHRRNRP